MRNQVSVLNKKIILPETKHNMVEQYGKRTNFKFTGIPDFVFQNELGNKVVDILSAIVVEVSKHNFEVCHRMRKS